MAGIQKADDQAETLLTLRIRLRHLHARAQSDPNAAAYLAACVACSATWATTFQTEMAKDDAITDGEAAAVTADAGLDALVRSVSAVFWPGKKVDATLPAAHPYFGGLSPSEFMQPVLKKQLQDMSVWPANLAASTVSGLAALAPHATTVIAAANAASAALSAAISSRDVFHNGGERKAVFDRYNAMAATAYGGLKAFAHSHPELNLPADYAESFFKSIPGSMLPKTLTEANNLVARLEQRLGRAKTVQTELTTKETTRAAQAAAHAKALADVATAKKALDDAKKNVKTTKATVKKSKPKKK